MFKTWEELTVVEQLQSEYSDFYKEVNGVRPRFMSEEQWNSEEWLRSEMEALAERAQVVFAEQDAREQECIAQFERDVAATVAIGANDRETAIRWMSDATCRPGDMDMLCYERGLPYGYFKKSVDTLAA